MLLSRRIMSKDINSGFKDYYIYNSEFTSNQDSCNHFFAGSNLPKLVESPIQEQEAHIALKELKSLLESMQKGRSPRLHVIPLGVYSQLWEIIGPHILNSFNYAFEHGT